MKITMLVGLSGPNFNLTPGDSHQTDEAEALRLIAAGFAVAAEVEDTPGPADTAPGQAAEEPAPDQAAGDAAPEQAAAEPAPEQAVTDAAPETAVRKPATIRKKG